MSLIRESDYANAAKQNKVVSPHRASHGGISTSIKVRFPTQHKTKKHLIICPTGCTQRRTKSYRLHEHKTFDTILNKCSNCGFEKKPAIAKFYGAGFKKASSLLVVKK